MNDYIPGDTFTLEDIMREFGSGSSVPEQEEPPAPPAPEPEEPPAPPEPENEAEPDLSWLDEPPPYEPPWPPRPIEEPVKRKKPREQRESQQKPADYPALAALHGLFVFLKGVAPALRRRSLRGGGTGGIRRVDDGRRRQKRGAAVAAGDGAVLVFLSAMRAFHLKIPPDTFLRQLYHNRAPLTIKRTRTSYNVYRSLTILFCKRSLLREPGAVLLNKRFYLLHGQHLPAGDELAVEHQRRRAHNAQA